MFNVVLPDFVHIQLVVDDQVHIQHVPERRSVPEQIFQIAIVPGGVPRGEQRHRMGPLYCLHEFVADIARIQDLLVEAAQRAVLFLL